MGLREGQVTVLIHSGSRGLGYQVCDDYLGVFKGAPKKYGFTLPDWQLACAPVRSPEGQAYLGAMRAAANYAWCNRQLLTHQAREVFARVFGAAWETLGIDLVYDVAHNIAKFETHDVDDGTRKQVCVHRKGATRAFPPGHPEVPEVYLGEVGAGRVVYFPWDIDRVFWEVLAVDHGLLLRNAVRWATDEEPPVRVTGPGVLDVTVWRQEGSVTVHLVNLTNPMMMKGPYRELLPVGEQRVVVRLPEGSRARRVRLLREGRELPVQQEGAELSLKVPSILDLEVVAIDVA